MKTKKERYPKELIQKVIQKLTSWEVNFLGGYTKTGSLLPGGYPKELPPTKESHLGGGPLSTFMMEEELFLKKIDTTWQFCERDLFGMVSSQDPFKGES